MSNERRTTDRRRRVLYTSQQAENTPSTPASRRAAELLREARRPTAAYGSRVNRRLRGRWFSLVPVRRRTLTTITASLALLVLLLCGAHYASVAWPSIAYQGEIARPLRLDRPDSFGRWVTCLILAASSGASLLIYQLRRYRNDDFQGQYRLWRMVLIVTMLASVNSLVSMIDWGGALLDATFARRVALAGNDWIRLVVTIGGAVLALRLIAEVRRSRWALVTMIAAWSLMAIPEAARWNIIHVDSVGKWALITAVPLIAFSTLFISLGGYLRMLYREVRQIDENDSLKERFQQFRVRVFRPSDDDLDSEAEPQDQPRQRWWGRRSESAGNYQQASADEDEQAWEQKEDQEQEDESKSEDELESEAKNNDEPRPRRGWFRRRSRKTQPDAEPTDQATEEDPPQQEPSKRRFSLRLRPQAALPAEVSEANNTSEPESDPDVPAKPRRGLGSWIKRGNATAAEEGEPRQEANSRSSRQTPARNDDHQQEANSDDIDWNSLSKAERRRLRKQLKRQGRAA